MVSVTPVYAALLLPLFLFLSWRVIAVRRSARISLGDGGQKALQARIRAHGNFVEYAPFALVLMLGAELAGAGSLWLHLAGIALVLGRHLHALCLSYMPRRLILRTSGMMLSFAALIVAAVAGLFAAL